MASIDSSSSQVSESKKSTGWRLWSPWSQKRPVERRPTRSRSRSAARPQNQQSLISIAKVCLLTRRRLRLDPDKKLFFLYEPGKQVSSAVTIKNVSRSFVAFKFQTNAPKSCFMRPPNGILAPNETIITSVVKFVEQPENSQDGKMKQPETSKERKTKDKFKIVSLKVKEGAEYTPELFEENKELIAVEKVLRVVFLDPQRPCKALDKLKRRLAEAEATNQARKKPQDDKAPKPPAAAEGVIDEWKERREKYLAKQQGECVDSG
uniref:MSP domain-containing protein n=1 Tax=Araucaria cunninghamii TaxID=56994 RepID=A0A0D6R1P2_ARACU